jgi:hypothetical protein
VAARKTGGLAPFRYQPTVQFSWFSPPLLALQAVSGGFRRISFSDFADCVDDNDNGVGALLAHVCQLERGAAFPIGSTLFMRGTLLKLLLCACLPGLGGCSLILPEVTRQPVIHNPFPQLSKVAVAPFFNHSDEATVDGRQFAMAYYAELQKTPGFEVVPVGVVEEAIIANRVQLDGPGEARRLAQILGVDAIVVGAVTDYSPYYPPRCGLRVEWYTANPGYHAIPVGYGLPWGTPEEEFIPDSLAYEARLGVARSQMAGQTPACEDLMQPLPSPPAGEEPTEAEVGQVSQTADSNPLRQAQAVEELPPGDPAGSNEPNQLRSTLTIDRNASTANAGPELTTATTPPCASDALCLPIESDASARPACLPHNGPVLTHTRIYRGNDPELTQPLKSYVYSRDDARFGGWEGYLQRSDDFVRFCCHMHISEMLSARGGSDETRVLWRWPESR